MASAPQVSLIDITELNSRPANVGLLYDFSPFHEAPAVLKKRLPDGKVHVITIPETTIPSPVADGITPTRVFNLRRELLGGEKSPKLIGGDYGGNGKEVWESWKRAWDLWNNHYIEGRVNPDWVCKEWAAIQDRKDRHNSQRYARKAQRQSGDDSEEWAFLKSPPKTEAEIGKEEEDGLGPIEGGFGALKSWKEYKEPCGEEEEDHHHHHLEREGEWIDALQNTVWAPRRVGEKTLNIGLDDDFREVTNLMQRGGVDCERSPYPVLRPLIPNIRTPMGAFLKKKVWDGVTGTIFNMPTKPLEPEPAPTDQRSLEVKQMYADRMGDRLWKNGDLFPLDIRRVKVVHANPKAVAPLLKHGEINLDEPDNPNIMQSTDLEKADPWWVTDEQRLKRDHPPRVYPLEDLGYTPNLIQTDEAIWKEEYTSDENWDTRYFVANLHGGTLLVNGIEVKKGSVAGPLPDFAVIETPGGQVSFWWGVQGRHWGGKKGLTDEAERWRTLRLPEDCKYLGMNAGQVWQSKFKDRIEREKTGNDLEDDEEWACWKKGNPYPLSRSKIPPPGYASGLKHITTEDEELQALILQYRHYQKGRMGSMGKRRRLHPPLLSNFWPGSNALPNEDLTGVTPREFELAKQKQTELRCQREAEADRNKYEQEEAWKRASRDNAAKRILGKQTAPAIMKIRFDDTLKDIKAKRLNEQKRKRQAIDKEYDDQKQAISSKRQKMLEDAVVAARRANNPSMNDADFRVQEEALFHEREILRRTLNTVRVGRGLPEISPRQSPGEIAQLRADVDRRAREAREAREQTAKRWEQRRREDAASRKKEEVAKAARDTQALYFIKRPQDEHGDPGLSNSQQDMQSMQQLPIDRKDPQTKRREFKIKVQEVPPRKQQEDAKEPTVLRLGDKYRPSTPQRSPQAGPTQAPKKPRQTDVSTKTPPTPSNTTKSGPGLSALTQTPGFSAYWGLREDKHMLRELDLESDFWRTQTGERSLLVRHDDYRGWEYTMWDALKPILAMIPGKDGILRETRLAAHRRRLVPELHRGLANRAWAHWIEHNPRSTITYFYKALYAVHRNYENFDALFVDEYKKRQLSEEDTKDSNWNIISATALYDAGDWDAQLQVVAGPPNEEPVQTFWSKTHGRRITIY
ncbi:hypothetical protein B0O99DRAFT_735526 [Bisporella sp. PMI_857]|nr:hypothetical protein B0O99DRAFT_735526 [Bisporella sp. PMI_857]